MSLESVETPPPASLSGAPETDPELTSPLARFAGHPPAAPSWFNEALANRPERRFIDVGGVDIETLAWGAVGRPGLMLLHGNRAHADWWSFIAPFFAHTHRVAAISWSGMGGSGWRERYSLSDHVDEILVCAEALGLFAAPQKPVLVGHSFGSSPLTRAAGVAGERLRLAVTVDSGVGVGAEPGATQPKGTSRPNRVYPTLEAALQRFRLSPLQPCENPFLVHHIARGALRPAPLPEGGEGWTWAFDPFANDSRGDAHRGAQDVAIRAMRCPLVVMWGAQSALVTPEVVARTRAAAPPGTPFIEIPNAYHHVMLDQPLAFVAALRAVLETAA